MKLTKTFLNAALPPQDYQSARGGQFTLRRLAGKHVDDCMTLQADILRTLPDDQTFIHVKKRRDYKNLSKDKGFLIGAFDKATGRLSGISAIRLPMNKKDDAGVLDMTLPAKHKKLATIESVMVCPQTQGHHLAGAMFNYANDALPKLGRKHALAIITRENFFSWRAFLRAGFEIMGAGFDPSDNSTVYYAHKNLGDKTPFRDQTATAAITPDMDLDDARTLFAMGYRGLEWDKPDILKLRR